MEYSIIWNDNRYFNTITMFALTITMYVYFIRKLLSPVDQNSRKSLINS